MDNSQTIWGAALSVLTLCQPHVDRCMSGISQGFPILHAQQNVNCYQLCVCERERERKREIYKKAGLASASQIDDNVILNLL